MNTRNSCSERPGAQPGVEAKSSTPCFLTGSASCQRALLMRGGTLEISATTRAAKRMKCLLAFCFTASSVTAFRKSGARTSLLKCNDQFFNCSVSATSSANCGKGTSHGDMCTTGYSTHTPCAPKVARATPRQRRCCRHTILEPAYSSADGAHRNNAEQLVAPIWELLLLYSFAGTFGVASVAQPCSMPIREV